MQLFANWTMHDTIATSIGLPICLALLGWQIWKDQKMATDIASIDAVNRHRSSHKLLELIQAKLADLEREVGQKGKPATDGNTQRDLAFTAYSQALDLCFRAEVYYYAHDLLIPGIATLLFNAANGEPYSVEEFIMSMMPKDLPGATVPNPT